MIKDFYIQLYSIRNEIENIGFAATFKELNRIGYCGVEFAGCGGFSAIEMKEMLEQNKLRSLGAHIGLDQLEQALEEELEYHKVLGTKYIIVPSAPVANITELNETIRRLQVLAPKITEAGFKFAFHNHDQEFAKDGNEYYLERIALEVPEICLELDVYWAYSAGVDNAAFIKKNAAKISALHIKQMDETNEDCDLGDGVIDLKALISLGLEIGITDYIHEQEKFAHDAFIGLENGVRFIRSFEERKGII